MSLEQTANFEFPISPHHRVWIDGEIHRKLADRGELVAGSERAGSEAPSHLIDQLAVHRDAAVEIESELRNRAVPVLPCHVYQCTIYLVH